MQREHLKSRLGFILLSAGCAIGIGNVWKFPYMVGQNGGGFFVLIYLFFLITLGIPVMTMEFAVGRASQKGITKMYQELEPKGSKWHAHGYIALIGNIILMMFYTVVSGWMLKYFVEIFFFEIHKKHLKTVSYETIITHRYIIVNRFSKKYASYFIFFSSQ
jgi:NSS family neurotransmitter:Na+ symporter